MKLPVNYGNFLLKKDSDKARFQHNKPIISLCVSAVMVFAVTGAALNGLALAYAHMTAPNQNYDINYFNKAQKLSTDVSKSLALYKDARPDDINAIKTVQVFSAKPAGVDIENIKIDSKKYIVTGSTTDMKLANEYLSKMNFGKEREAAISNITTKEDKSIFTITVTEKAKQPKAKQKKGGAGK